jgi:PAS domain S-box-containing protein
MQRIGSRMLNHNRLPSTKTAVAGAQTIPAQDESGELLRLAVQVGGIGIFDTDLEGKRTRFSSELCTILGLPAGTQLDYADSSRIVDERDQAAVNAIMEAARDASDEGAWSSTHRIVRPDGTVRWISVNGRRYYRNTSKGRRAVRSIGTVIDVSHLKASEEALRQSELRLRFALGAAQMGTFEVEIGGTEAIIDAQEAKLLGLPPDTRIVPIDELRARIPMEDLQASDAKKERLEQHHESYHHELRLSMPDGSERWLSAYAAIRSGRIYGVNFDITQRKRTEIALRDSEAHLRVAVNGAAFGVFERDIKTDHTVWMNDRMYEIFGRARADGSLSKQEFVEDYLHPDDVAAFEAAATRAMRAGDNFHVICRIRQKSGAQRWLQFDGKYELTETGEPSRLVAVIADITERKTLEQEAAELSDRLITLQEEERQLIARELHDSTVQHLVAANLNLMSLRPKSASGNAEVWDQVEGSMQEAMRELRTFSYLMHPPALHSDGLRSTIGQYVDGYAARSGLIAKVRLSPKLEDLPFQKQRALLRIVQEALANVHRHASASRVSVSLRRIAGSIHLTIADDGRGMEGTSAAKGHASVRPGVGILGIRERARQFGGDLKMQTGSQGTRLHIVLPVSHASRAASSKISSKGSQTADEAA